MNHAKKILILLMACYLLIATFNALSGPDSIDEFSFSYWSNRVSQNIAAPFEALRLPPEADKKFGHVGFLRSGYFVYDKPLSSIAAGEQYHVIPMLHYVPLIAFGLIKSVSGEWAHFFIHTLSLVLAILLPVLFHIRHNNGREAAAFAALLLATPAYLANTTYAMTDGVGTLAMSIFCYIIAVRKRAGTQDISTLQAIIVLASTVLFTFYKPIGIVFLPWSIYITLTQLRFSKRNIAIAATAVIICGGVAFGAKQFYSNYLWAGYNNVLNHYLYKSYYNKADIIASLESELDMEKGLFIKSLSTTMNKRELLESLIAQAKAQGKEIDIARLEALINNITTDSDQSDMFDNLRVNLNAVYKPLGLATAYPFFIVLIFAAGKVLFRKAREIPRPFFKRFLFSDFTNDVAFVFPCIFLFFFFMAYSQYPELTYHIKLTTPLTRYMMILSVILLWYIVDNDALPSLRKVFVPLLVLQAIVLVTFPQNIPMRMAFKAYNTVLEAELHKHIGDKHVILGGYRYDKFFDPEKTPSYAFLAHQRSMSYTKCMNEYRSALGTTDDVIRGIIDAGHIPVVIYPDYIFPDDRTVPNPYWDIRTDTVTTIDMAERAGIFGKLLPETYREIHIAEVSLKQ